MSLARLHLLLLFAALRASVERRTFYVIPGLPDLGVSSAIPLNAVEAQEWFRIAPDGSITTGPVRHSLGNVRDLTQGSRS